MFLSVLKNAQFRNFLISDVISGFGVGMATIGANWYVMTETGSNQYVGFLLTFNVLSGFLVSPLAGMITDRFDRKKVILWTYVLRAVLLALLAVLFIVRGFSIPLMYGFAVINGIGWTIYMAASRSLVQEILPEKVLANGNSFIEISLQVGMFSAGALSGIIYKFYGFEVILLINITVFLVSSAVLAAVRYPSIVHASTEGKQDSFWQSFRAGFTFLRQRQTLFWLGVISIVPLAVTMLYNVVLPAYVNITLQSSSIVFGLADMFYGIGGLVSGFLVSLLIGNLSNKQLVCLFFTIAVVNLFALYANPYVWLVYVGSLLLGLCNSSLRIVMNTLLMENVQKAFMGRAMAVWTGLSLLIQAGGSSGIGLIIDRFGASYGFLIMSVMMAIGLIGFVALAERMHSLTKKETTRWQTNE
ncbi:MFS transporter [Paenibacillus campi]|uniref:MFS transporter n=1 Tax=Paenibacillus campi TaxID=3106031 RepID=UPI002AFF9637|nr:MFS transporter [Paenibacillus sp. SGZ-1014]